VLTVSDRFLARPRDPTAPLKAGLLAHSLKTAYRAKELASGVGLGEVGFYAGLLHDIGKLNPYYQILFSSEPWNRQVVKRQLDKEYVRAHALFSALAVNSLTNIPSLPKGFRKQVLFAVAGHHSKLTQFHKSLSYINRDKERFNRSFQELNNYMISFSQDVRALEEFKGLAWDSCLRRFSSQNVPLNETDYVADGKDFVLDFLSFSSVFSALIQADRGSFFDDLKQPAFGINLDTGVLVRTGFPLSGVRISFQKKLLLDNKFEDNLLILKAPTGIGKTKIFLDIVNKVSDSSRFERVFYFSPLLALTDDFEGKLFGSEKGASVLNPTDAEKVLVYNHSFVGSLLKKRLNEDEGLDDPEFFKTQEHFERESFNKELIITTTQRLLMVLYSNEPSEKEKLLSFKNSFLIIDEVQTIPKFLLPNLIVLFKWLTVKYNSKILLVSATIPNELKSLPKLKTPKDVEETYLQMTAKRIEYSPVLDAASEVSLLRSDERTLFMFNTRRKALCFFEELSALRPNVVYLSTGIRKRDRGKIIGGLHGSAPGTVVSTQVLEAGVDVSFSRMYREMAPLDNIVQAMGRLNREGEARSEPVLSVFLVDGKHVPYSELEVEESKRLIPQMYSSVDLYNALPDYYKKVSSENLLNKNLTKELDFYMKNLDFDEVWAFVRKYALPMQLGDSLLIPDFKDWESVKKDFLNPESNKDRSKAYKRYAELIAQLPRAVEKTEGLEGLLDEELLEVGVFLPKKEALNEVYDSKVGLDKWVKNGE
jgi:CRISPR-associated endonuclease/helicase Cas3